MFFGSKREKLTSAFVLAVALKGLIGCLLLKLVVGSGQSDIVVVNLNLPIIRRFKFLHELLREKTIGIRRNFQVAT